MKYLNSPCSHLPTPQSPHSFGQYIRDVLHTPDSPASSTMTTPIRQKAPPQRSHLGEARVIIPPPLQQIITPEASPIVRPPNRPISCLTTQHPFSLHLSDETLAPHDADPATSLAPSPRVSSPVSSSDAQSSCLSSPFMEKRTVPSKAKSRTPSQPPSRSLSPTPLYILPNSAPSPMKDPSLLPSLTPFSPRPPTSHISKPLAGGEIQRIRQILMQDRLAYHQEAESRRPDYLKRTKRTISEADPTVHDEDEKTRQCDREAFVGIMESPTKGRRLTLFQETSEESFEESLMLGGYGRYRTAEWVRQPQPMSFGTPGVAGSASVVSALENSQEVPQVPPTEREVKKRKRLAAFRRPHEVAVPKLHPIELVGVGRVIMDLSGDEDVGTSGEFHGKKRSAARRKKKVGVEKKSPAIGMEPGVDLSEKPNWPDSEFPWRLREEERVEAVNAEEAEKLKWIEKFFSRDSDEEDEEEPALDEAEHWGGTQGPQPMRRGRGKWVPLPASPNRRPYAQRKALYASDPADARAALFANRSVRTLAFRQERRSRQVEETEAYGDDQILCLCNGRDDGRELVQCDGCETWYHLDCIGIKDISELGDVDDPWYCRDCDEYGRRSPLLTSDVVAVEEAELSSEPTFVPTDEALRVSPSYDPPFYQAFGPQGSPMPWPLPPPSSAGMPLPWTPRRTHGAGQYDCEYSSSPSWAESSKDQPSTPQHPVQDAQVAVEPMPGQYEPHVCQPDESPFDPASTPSRGIKLGAPFTTPKNAWAARGNGLFQTPLAVSVRAGGGEAAPGFKVPHSDETPIRRMKSGEGGFHPRRMVHSPLTARTLIVMPNSLLEESPVGRLNGREE